MDLYDLRPVLKIRFKDLADKVYMTFWLSPASIVLKTSSCIDRVACYTHSSTYVLSLDSFQNMTRPDF